MAPDEPREASLLRAAGARRDERLAALLEAHRERLARMLDLRMDPALRARVAASDVLQETWIEVQERIDGWLEDPSMPFYLWLRFLALQRLLKARRFHAAHRRDAGRQVAAHAPQDAHATSAGLLEGLAASQVSPSGVAMAAEQRAALHEALEALDPIDREVLALRHFEELSNADVAEVLGIQADAASKRYLRALERMRSALGARGKGAR